MVTPTRRSLWKWLASQGGEQSFYMETVNSEWPVTSTVFLETFPPSQPKAHAEAVTYLCLFSYSGEELSRLSDVLCAVPGVPVCFAVSPLELYFDKLYWAEKRVFLWVCVSCTLIIGVREQQEQDCCTRGGQGRSWEWPWHRLADRGTACRVWAPELGAGNRLLQLSLTWWARNLVLAGGLVRSERIQRQDLKQGCDVDLPRGQGCGRACQWHSLSRDWRPRAELGPTGRGPGWGWLGPVKPTSAFRPR